MQSKASMPIIIVAIVVVVGLLVVLGRQFMSGPPTNHAKPVYPSFIDPATGKPKAGMGGASGETPAPSSRYQMPGGGGAR